MRGVRVSVLSLSFPLSPSLLSYIREHVSLLVCCLKRWSVICLALLHLFVFRQHCVLLKFVDGTSQEQKEEVASACRTLPSQIPQIVEYHVGIDLSLDPGRNHDVAITADFRSNNDYEIYAKHPIHLAVINNTIKPLIAVGGRSACQFEVNVESENTLSTKPAKHRLIDCLLAQLTNLKAENASLRARLPRKPVLALDIDEVLAQFLPALIRFHNATYKTSLTLKDFHSYWFCKVWGGTNEEATEKVHAFFESAFFTGIEPMPGAKEALAKLKVKYDFCIVTSRQHIIAENTIQWSAVYQNLLDLFLTLTANTCRLDTHFPDLFAGSSVPKSNRIMFGNHWSRESPGRFVCIMTLFNI